MAIHGVFLIGIVSTLTLGNANGSTSTTTSRVARMFMGCRMNSNEAIAFLRSIPGETISPKELAMVAGGSPYSYNIAAKEGNLNLPHMWRGRNLRIWKGPVIRLIGGNDVQAISDGRGEADEGSDGRRRSEGTDWITYFHRFKRLDDSISALGSAVKGGEK